eukprot:3842293-Amphidinium_carterae.1
MLLSRSAQAELGVVLDVEANTADFKRLELEGVALKRTGVEVAAAAVGETGEADLPCGGTLCPPEASDLLPGGALYSPGASVSPVPENLYPRVCRRKIPPNHCCGCTRQVEDLPQNMCAWCYHLSCVVCARYDTRLGVMLCACCARDDLETKLGVADSSIQDLRHETTKAVHASGAMVAFGAGADTLPMESAPLASGGALYPPEGFQGTSHAFVETEQDFLMDI